MPPRGSVSATRQQDALDDQDPFEHRRFGFNELRFEDKAGSEEIFLQAQKDYNKVVLNNETVKITQDTTTTVEKGNRSVTVSQGNDCLTVSTGDHTITVSPATAPIKAGQSILLQVSGNSVQDRYRWHHAGRLQGSPSWRRSRCPVGWRPVDDAAGRADRDQLSGAHDGHTNSPRCSNAMSVRWSRGRVARAGRTCTGRSAIPSRAIEAAIAAIDRRLSEQLNLILHHADFQRMEAAWRGLCFLVDAIENGLMLKIKVLDISKQELAARCASSAAPRGTRARSSRRSTRRNTASSAASRSAC